MRSLHELRNIWSDATKGGQYCDKPFASLDIYLPSLRLTTYQVQTNTRTWWSSRWHDIVVLRIWTRTHVIGRPDIMSPISCRYWPPTFPARRTGVWLSISLTQLAGSVLFCFFWQAVPRYLWVPTTASCNATITWPGKSEYSSVKAALSEFQRSCTHWLNAGKLVWSIVSHNSSSGQTWQT